MFVQHIEIWVGFISFLDLFPLCVERFDTAVHWFKQSISCPLIIYLCPPSNVLSVIGRVTIRAKKYGSGSPGTTKRVIYQIVRYNL